MTSKIKVDNITDQDDNNIINESGDVITVGAAGDTVAVAGNIVKSNALQASDAGNIISQSGTTITIGASGDTVSLASGASQSGFGRSGTVDWQTSIKTSNFDAVSGQGFFVNSGSGAITATLPTSPSAGDIVSIADYGFNAATNKITIGRNSQPINGFSVDGEITTNGGAATLVYSDSTKGWVAVNDTTTGVVAQEYVAATGGTVTTVCTDFKVHTFTGPGTFCVSNAGNAAGSNTVDYLVIAGGGGGGGGESSNGFGGSGGAGGAGGYRYSATTYCAPSNSPTIAPGTALPVSAQGYPITVGGGSSGGNGVPHSCTAQPGGRGSNSVFSTITATGGGGGSGCGNSHTNSSAPGGSGGGNSGDGSGGAGCGNTPPVSPPQGHNGGAGVPDRGGGGGGGAIEAGNTDGNRLGGDGDTNAITGSGVARGGGGGGGNGSGNTATAAGGDGGGGTGSGSNGNSSSSCGGVGGNGSSNTGGGGGGKGAGGGGAGGTGGSGVVIIRYKFQN